MTSFLQVVDIAGLAFLLFILYSLAIRDIPDHPNSPPIVQTYVPWLGSALRFALRRTALFNDYRARYGPVYKFLVAGRYIVVVSSPRAITNVIDMSPKVFVPFEESSFQLLAGLSERLPYVIELLHRTAYVFIANGLTKRSMGSITIPMNKNLFAHLQSHIDTPDAVKCLPLHDFVSPSLYCASTASFFGTLYVPDTFPDYDAMDRGMFYILNHMRLFSGESYSARSKMVASLEPYVRMAWESDSDGYVEGASSIISDSLRELRRGGLSVSEATRLLVAVLWGFNSNLIQAAIDTLAYVLADSSTYYRISADVRSAIAEKYPDIETLLAADPEAIDCNEFAILDSVIQETLRITSLATSFREALCDTYLTGDDGAVYLVRKGEYVVADVRGMHHDAKLFPQPQSFVADRFINDKASSKIRGIRRFRPWGGGAFVCKGREFAHYVIKMFLLQTIYLFDIEPGEYTPSLYVDRCPTIARLRGSPMIRLRKRSMK